MPERTVQTNFYTITQNNSGGIFDHDARKGVGYALCVEALNVEDAKQRLETIISSYPASYDCPCCGDRWSIYLWDDDASEEPTLYGRPLSGGWGIPSYIHYMDGRIEAREESKE